MSATTGGRRLVRSRDDRWIAGICGGIAAFLGWSPAVIRLLFVVFAFTGIGEIVYLVLWVLMPKAPRR